MYIKWFTIKCKVYSMKMKFSPKKCFFAFQFFKDFFGNKMCKNNFHQSYVHVKTSSINEIMKYLAIVMLAVKMWKFIKKRLSRPEIIRYIYRKEEVHLKNIWKKTKADSSTKQCSISNSTSPFAMAKTVLRTRRENFPEGWWQERCMGKVGREKLGQLGLG